MPKFCCGMSRRNFLTVGAVGGLGLHLGDWFALRAASAAQNDYVTPPVVAESIIHIFLPGGLAAQETFDDVYGTYAANDDFWTLPIGDPGPLGLFADPVYDRGALTLHALRLKVGDKDFFEAARLWVKRYDDRTATTADFQKLYEEVSGLDLDEFFDTWLFTPEKPVKP